MKLWDMSSTDSRLPLFDDRQFPLLSTAVRFGLAFVIFMTALGWTGCAGKFIGQKGDKVIRKNYLILLKDGKQQGEWKTNELGVSYQYETVANALNISGTVKLIGGFSVGFQWITHLDTHLLLLDDQGRILEIVPVLTSGLQRVSDSIPMKFELNVPLPEGTHTFSFAYEGELKGAGALDSSTFDIRFTPVAK
jgi:hypothetical protein